MRRAEVISCALLAGALLAGSGCAAGEPSDPLDPALIRELSTAQGSASGSARAGAWRFGFTTAACDCPELALDGQSLALCELATLRPLDATVSEFDGHLIVEFPAAVLSALTGPIDADGSFSVAGLHDVSTIAGPLELIGRLDGSVDGGDALATGDAAQRLIGELSGEPIDCRWTGEFVAERQ